MPNWATNKLVFDTESDLERAIEIAIDPNSGEFDFNRIIPIPDAVANTVATSSLYQIELMAAAVGATFGENSAQIESKLVKKFDLEPNDRVVDLAKRISEAVSDKATFENIRKKAANETKIDGLTPKDLGVSHPWQTTEVNTTMSHTRLHDSSNLFTYKVKFSRLSTCVNFRSNHGIPIR